MSIFSTTSNNSQSKLIGFFGSSKMSQIQFFYCKDDLSKTLYTRYIDEQCKETDDCISGYSACVNERCQCLQGFEPGENSTCRPKCQNSTRNFFCLVL